MPVRFTHITFTVADFARTIAFYREVCGLDVVRDRRAEGGSTVWLGPPTAAGALPPWVFVLQQGEVTDRLDHVSFQCDTAEEFEDRARLGARLGVISQGPVDLGGTAGRAVILRDPDGHGVEFTFGQPIAGV